jgi:hypothetical protein
MSRWFIAVFALHFLASVLLSTLGLAQPRALEAVAQASQVQLSDAPALQRGTPDTASLLDDYDHALMDDQQDLSDILHESPEPAPCTPPGCAHGPSAVPDRPSRTLAPPDKPPRARLA